MPIAGGLSDASFTARTKRDADALSLPLRIVPDRPSL
jgi:hypothetical protein